MRPLAQMLDSLVSPLLRDDARQEHAMLSFARASEVAGRLPLVHRTCKLGSESLWLEVLRTRRFVANEPCTGDREKAAGIPLAAYFFLGCGAYPDGLVGFVLDTPSVLALPASYTPFDSGSIEKYAVPDGRGSDLGRSGAGSLPLRARGGRGGCRGVRRALSRGALSRRPGLRALGQHSIPDFPAYHGLQSTSGDRRAWTIEVQVHEHVAFGAGGATLTEIVAARQALVEDLPDDPVALARVATVENEVLESIAEGIATRIAAAVP